MAGVAVEQQEAIAAAAEEERDRHIGFAAFLQRGDRITDIELDVACLPLEAVELLSPAVERLIRCDPQAEPDAAVHALETRPQLELGRVRRKMKAAVF